MSGKLKISGNVMLAQKLKVLVDAVNSKKGGAAAPAPVAAAAAPKTALKVARSTICYTLSA